MLSDNFARLFVVHDGDDHGAGRCLGWEVAQLAATDAEVCAKAIDSIAKTGGPAATAVLEALDGGQLRIDAAGNAYRQLDNGRLEPIPGVNSNTAPPRPPLASPVVDNALHRILDPALATLRLKSVNLKTRLMAAENLAKQTSDTLVPIVRHAYAVERNPKVRRALAQTLAWFDIDASDDALRLSALRAIVDSPDLSFKPKVEQLLAHDSNRQPIEKSASIRAAASNALSAIRWRETWTNTVGNVFYGMSLGSVLLLISLGLAITFGLMRVINMAHGELLMIGAYATYLVQQAFQAYLPAYADSYLVAAIPVAFAVSGAVGMLIERLVLRFLYGRPLETLLATWGVSLVLIQVVRRLFGAQNVTVSNPTWLRGGWEGIPNVVFTYSRSAVIVFSMLVASFVWFVLRRTHLGLQVRAVTENRDMASALGIRTRRIDSWTFAIGAGVAGLGGVALSQLGNVGPELGQGYIIDAFMVVVLGGVGNLGGTLVGALGLGIANKLAEPIAGAVLGKILILVFIIIFIQRRPQGLFALRGRAAEVG